MAARLLRADVGVLEELDGCVHPVDLAKVYSNPLHGKLEGNAAFSRKNPQEIVEMTRCIMTSVSRSPAKRMPEDHRNF